MSTQFKTASDFRKSLENRLKNLSGQMQVDLQRLRRTVAFDRLLARLLVNDDDFLVLKGGYAMELRLAHARATKDIDLTCLQRIKKGSFKEVILEKIRMLAHKDLGDFFAYQIG